MIIESVKLKNIRSIKNLEIEFPPSTMLFYGDIGSGKSSLLKAIEFGLFGTLTAAELSGDSLLRRGENRGTVELTFLIDNKRYTIKRTLKRTIKNKKSTISQEEGSIIEYHGGEISKTSLAPTDLRRKILKLLNYSITRYENAQKIPLFRYTVYTPQEQVKEILQAKPEERFEILKDVFGIEKYEIALKNISVLNEFLYNSIKETKIYLDSIGDPNLLINKKGKEIDEQVEIVNKIQDSLEQSIADLEKVELQVEDLQSEVNEYSKKLVEIDNYGKIIEESIISKAENKNSQKILLEEISTLEQELQNIPKLKLDIDLTEEELEKEIKEHRKNQSKKEKELVILEEKISNINKLLKEGKCSLCGQEIHEKERFNSELKDTKKRIESLSKVINELLDKINTFELNLKKLRAFTVNQTKIVALSKLIEEKRKRENKLKEIITQLEQKVKEAQDKTKKILKRYKITDLENFKEYESQLNFKLLNQKNLIKNLKLEKSDIEKNLSAENAKLKILSTELDKLKDDLLEKKKFQEKIAFLTELRNWITEDFQILIRDIEREIISASARQFNEYFKEWFGTLVEEENIEVEIRLEDFEPIIMVNGYESPFRDLSGGEKSALSLAYRLALDKIINERYQEVKTKDLLILDEPTDGFSQEQINKMQDIFEKLDTMQMFIISHDRNLDSFVTDIFNFKKERHVTKVIKEHV